MEQLTSNPRPKSVSTHTVNARRSLSYDKSTKYRAFCFYTTFPDLYLWYYLWALLSQSTLYLQWCSNLPPLSHFSVYVSAQSWDLFTSSVDSCLAQIVPKKRYLILFSFPRVLIKENCSTLEGNGPFKVFTLKTPIQRLSSHIKYYTDVGLWG